MICSRLKTSVGRVRNALKDSEFDGREPKRGAGKLGEMLFGIERQPALRQRGLDPFASCPRAAMRRRMTFTLATSSRGLKGLVT